MNKTNIGLATRFNIKKQLGQGSFSTIYSAFDYNRKEWVALKVEKADKSKKVLMFEYQVLKNLQGLPNICKIYDFIESNQPNGLNFIVMQMLGKNLATIKKQKGKDFTTEFALKLLLQMLDAIRRLHDRGYIHRDVKPSNFVMGKGKTKNLVYMVDFGLAKQHLTKSGIPIEQRPTADFRGTITYASLNAHNKIDLSRRDDLWSFYFVILDFLNEQLPWRNCRDNKVDDVRDVKIRCLADPERELWKTTTTGIAEVKNIFYSLNRLQYADRPDYDYIQGQLQQMLDRELSKTATKTYTNKRKRKAPQESVSPPIAADVSPPMGNLARLPEMPFPGASLPPIIPPTSYLPHPTGYMMPTPRYPGIYYNYPYSQLAMMPQFLGNCEEPRMQPNEEQKMDAMQKPYCPFPTLMMPYSAGYPKDRIQFVSPNFININNVNALGTALIINNGAPQKQTEPPEPQKAPPSSFKPTTKDSIFKVDVDHDYYRNLYAEK